MIYFDRLCLAKCYLPETGHQEVCVVARFLAAAQITGMHAELTRRKPVLWRGAHAVPPLLSIAQKIQTLICRVAASASEWRFVHSLTLAATEVRDRPASHEAGHYGPLAGARGTEESSVQRTLVSGAFFHANAGAVRKREFTIDDGRPSERQSCQVLTLNVVPASSPGEARHGAISRAQPKLTWGGQASAEVLADHRYDYP